jgi:cystathionine gamma-synthase
VSDRPSNEQRDPEGLDPTTLAIHAGRDRTPGASLSAPPTFASAFHANGERGYAREGNPTWEAFEVAVAALEGAAEAVAFPSGMAAAATLASTLPQGAKVVIATTAHAEVRGLFAELNARGAATVMDFDPQDEDFAALATADMVWCDSIANPTLEVAPIDRIATAAREAGATLVVDATLATPVLQRPLELGATASLHSASKYLGGHSDLLLGVISTSDHDLATRLRERRSILGSTPGTMEAWLALRGLRTLPLRVERGQQSARLLSTRLAATPDVEGVRYPNPSDPTTARVLDGPGAMISFEVEGGAARADTLCESLELILSAGSLGGVETLIERHARWRGEPGIPEGLLRLSVGCEDPEDLWRDLEQALARSAHGFLERGLA